ncbi:MULTISPECIES: helix-turn-helix transcriptional regulator [unclassified Corynebacterium]|uniref:helix-turn-helix transcriptional regulator n=1 Tax=unclassified Corynebacterium TaxID=2624378 RepID=UPI0035264F69
MTQIISETRGTNPSIPHLTQREVEVMRAWFISPSKGAAADSLRICEDTVRSHTTNVRNKYHAVGRDASKKAAMMARMIEDGYLSNPI